MNQISREHPLTEREVNYLEPEERELYEEWLKAPLSGHKKINFKALLKKLIESRHWLSKMKILEEIHKEVKNGDSYKKYKTEQDILDQIEE